MDIVLPNGNLIGACAPHGVAVTPKWIRLEQASKAVEMTIPECSMIPALAWANAQIGKPYDWLGVLGIGLHRDWQEDDRWQCSEFAGMVLKAGGVEPYRAEAMRRLDPQHLFSLNYSIEVLK